MRQEHPSPVWHYSAKYPEPQSIIKNIQASILQGHEKQERLMNRHDQRRLMKQLNATWDWILNRKKNINGKS